MAAANTGKLIIRSIPDGTEREQVIDYLCTFAKGAAREAVAARLATLPLTLGNAMPADTGNRIMSSLQELGAEVMFIYDRIDKPANPVVAATVNDQQPEPAHAAEAPAPRKAAGPAPAAPAANSGSGNNDIRTLFILLLVIVAGLCGATAIYLPALKTASAPELLLNKLLQKNAARNNKSCPRNMNADLRLDGFVAGDKKMTINYTLLKINAGDVNGDDLRPAVSRNIRRGICKEGNSAELLKQGVAFVFAVHGKDGGLIFDYQVLHEDCEYT